MTELRFILEDLVVKLQEIISDSAVKSKNNPMTFTTLQLVKPSDFITDCIRLFPYLTKHCHKIIECMQVSDLMPDCTYKFTLCYNKRTDLLGVYIYKSVRFLFVTEIHYSYNQGCKME